MTYESDPAGLGVGKRYGPLHLGGMQGAMRGAGAYTEAIFEVTFEELDASTAQVVKIPPYSRISQVLVEVDEVFGTGDTFDIHLDGNDVTLAVIPVSALGMLEPALTGTDADLTTGATVEDLTLDVALIDAGTPETGKAKIVVRYATV